MIKPLGKRLLVKTKEKQETSKSGIILSSNRKEKFKLVEIIELGNCDSKEENIGNIESAEKNQSCEGYDLEVGDNILIEEYSGIEISFESEEYLIVKQSDVLAKVI